MHPMLLPIPTKNDFLLIQDLAIVAIRAFDSFGNPPTIKAQQSCDCFQTDLDLSTASVVATC